MEEFSANFQKSCPFRIDHKPDLNNLIYGSIYKGHIPRYRCRFTTCLGDNTLYIKKRDKPRLFDEGRYHNKHYRKLSRTWKIMQISKLTRKNAPADFQNDYIPISDEIKNTDVKTEFNPLGIYDAATTSYVSGVDKKVQEKNIDECYEDQGILLVRQNVAEYNRYLKVNLQPNQYILINQEFELKFII